MHFGPTFSTAALEIPSHEHPVEAKETALYLGIIFDWKLTWNAHLEQMEAKTSKRLAAISCLAGSTWGIGVKELRHIFTACILPLTSYGATAWLPDNTRGGGQMLRYQKTMVKLRGMQKQAGKAISGGYARVAGEAYDVELNLLIDLHMEIATTKAALRIMSTSTFQEPETQPPPDSPLARQTAQIEARAGKLIAGLELKRPYIHASWDTLPFAVIAKDKLSALIDHERLIVEEPALRLYSDGSGIEGHIGAAAVSPDLWAV